MGLLEGGAWGQSDQPHHPTRALPLSGAPSCLQDTQLQQLRGPLLSERRVPIFASH